MKYKWEEIKTSLTDYEVNIMEAHYGLGVYKAHTYRELSVMFNRPYRTIQNHVIKIKKKIKERDTNGIPSL